MRQALSWLPVLLLAVAIVVVHILQPQFRRESQALVSMLYTLFCAAPAIMVVFLAGHTFVATGSLRMLLLGLGAVFFSAIYMVSALLLPDYNAGVTVHNGGFLFSGACFLLSGLIGARAQKRPARGRAKALAVIYLIAIAAMGIWIWAAFQAALPTFYFPDAGYSLLRHSVLGLGIAAFACSSLWYGRIHYRKRDRFAGWFSQSLAIITVAMAGAVFLPAGGTIMAWIVRAGQCIGGLYMVAAILCAIQDSQSWRIPLERALQESEDRLTIAMQSARVGMWSVDIPSHRWEFCPEAAGVFGLPADAPATLEQIIALTHPDDVARLSAQSAVAIQDAGLHEFEYRIIRPDGQIRWVLLRGRTDVHPDGRPRRNMGIVMDVTELKETEQERERLSRQLQATLDNIVEGVVIADMQGNLITMNPSALALHDYKNVAQIRRPLSEFSQRFELTNMEGRPVKLADWPLARALRGETFVDMDVQVHCKDTGRRWIGRYSGAPVHDQQGNPMLAVLTLRDITEHKRIEQAIRLSEEKYRSLFETMSEGFVVGRMIYDQSGRASDYQFVEVNDAYERLTGIDRRLSLQKTIREIIPTLEANWIEQHARVVDTGQPGHWESYNSHTGKHYSIYTYRPSPGHFASIFTDITERKRFEETLQRTEARWNAAVESFAEGAIIATENEQVIYWNPAARRLHGIAGPDEFIEPLEKTPLTFELWTPDGSHKLELDEWPMRRIKRGETLRNLELRVRRPDQGWEKIFSYSGAMVDTAGGERLIFLTCHDLTELRRTEQALREGEARLRALVDNLPFEFWAMDASGRYVVANPVCTAAWGGRVGKTPEDVAPSPEILQQWHRNNERAFAGEIVTGEVTYERNGRRFAYHTIIAPVQIDNEVHGILGVNIDLTERKRAEEDLARERELLRSVFDNIPVLLVMWDPRLQRFTLNRHAEAVLGWDEADANDGDFIRKVYPDMEYRAEVVNFMRSLESGWRKYNSTAKTGETIPCQWANIKLADDTMIGIGVDLRERKKAEQALRELNESLEQRVAERTEQVSRQADQLRALASQLSKVEQSERKRLAKILHDHIQQLIVGAKMQLEWMKRDDNLERLRATAQGVYATLDEAQRASRSLTVELSPPVLHETGLIGGLNWLVSRMQEQHQLAVRMRADTAAEPPTEEIRFLLFECIREVLLNAVKHSGVREADVTLMRHGDGKIKVVVRDQGKGFDPDVVKNRRPDEVSFGLFSIQERLAHLGGSLDIESAPGRGTQVTLTVPVAEEELAAEPLVETRQADRATVKIRHKPKTCRVLIVDDHQIVREGLARLFEFESDIEVAGQAADGPEAIAYAARLKPDVVLMDINLGEMDGIEATRRILAADPEIKVIGLSMHIDMGIANAMRDAGAATYLTKGGPSEDLIEAIRACHRS